jgi:hypothetical protein
LWNLSNNEFKNYSPYSPYSPIHPSALATWLCISKVIWHLALTTSMTFLLISYKEHMLMMYGCLLTLESDFLVLFSSPWMRYRVFCWISEKMRAPMAYRLLFWRTVHLLLSVQFLFFLTDLYRHVFLLTGG